MRTSRFHAAGAAALLLLLFGPTASSAEILAQSVVDCASDCVRSKAVWTMWRDDCTGQVYSMLINCDDQVYFGVSDPWGSVSPAGLTPSLPSNFWEMIATANFRAPGEDCGYFIVDAATGAPIRFRNPRDAGEISAIRGAYECTIGTLPAGAPGLN